MSTWVRLSYRFNDVESWIRSSVIPSNMYMYMQWDTFTLAVGTKQAKPQRTVIPFFFLPFPSVFFINQSKNSVFFYFVFICSVLLRIHFCEKRLCLHLYCMYKYHCIIMIQGLVSDTWDRANTVGRLAGESLSKYCN